MMTILSRACAWIIPLLVQLSTAASSAQPLSNESESWIATRLESWEVSLEGLEPTSDSRAIRTINLNGAFTLPLIKQIRLLGHGGITATYAWGSITQYGQNFTDSVIPNTAGGLGLYYALELTPVKFGDISIGLYGGHGLIFYSRDFPSGGDIYNFMFRIGGDLKLLVSDRREIILGYRWMHVSNGQGLGAFNPSYEAQGIHLAFRTQILHPLP